MAIDPRTPVLIGTGQVVQRAEGIDDARDAVALMGEAITLAAADAGLKSVPNPDAIRVVSLLSWKYGNPAALIAEDLGLTPRETGLSAMGGNTPQTLVNKASREKTSARQRAQRAQQQPHAPPELLHQRWRRRTPTRAASRTRRG